MATQQTLSMVSEVSICNQALSWLGQDPITSLDDNSKAAEWMNNNYPFLRDAVISERMWSFALARETSETADESEWGNQYKHSVPVGWLAVFRCFSNVDSNRPDLWVTSDGWSKEGNYVLSYDSIVYLWGTQRIVDTGIFSELFVQALAARMAADAAIPLTRDRKLQADMWSLYAGKLATAGVMDSMQGSHQKIKPGRLVSRRGQW